MEKEQLDKLIDDIWARYKGGSEINWLNLEGVIRDVMREYSDDKLTARESLIIISEALGAITGRGVAL